MMLRKFLAKNIASLFFIGYLPASGSIASALTVAAWYFIPQLQSLTALFIIGFASFIAIKYIPSAMIDPKWIIIDEVVGMLISLYHAPSSSLYVVASIFIIFRIIDIFKLGIGWIERYPHYGAVMADDIAAGIMTNFIVRSAYAFLA